MEFLPDADRLIVPVLRVAPDNITPLWPQVVPLLGKVLDRARTHDAEDVRRMLLVQTAQLWIQWNERVEAAVVTEFVTYPKGLFVRLWLAGALPQITVEWVALEDMIGGWAKANHCAGLELVGRMGWLRRFPKAAFEGIVMRKAL